MSFFFAIPIIFGTLSVLTFSTKSSERCHALVLAGGGDHGAFEAGVIDGITALSNTTWNVIVSTSSGSLNAATLGQYPIGEEVAGAAYARLFWSELDHQDIYKEWPGGLVEGMVSTFFGAFTVSPGLLKEPGLLDTSPAIRILAPKWLHVDKLKASGRHIEIGATNLNTFEYTPFDPTKLSDKEVLDALIASTAIPGLFPPVKFGPYFYVDGGVAQNTPVATSIAKCHALGYSDADITVDVCLADGQMIDSPEIILTPFVLLRALGSIVTNFIESDLAACRELFSDVTFRIFEPRVPLPGYFIGFGHEDIMLMMDIGYAEAETVLGG